MGGRPMDEVRETTPFGLVSRAALAFLIGGVLWPNPAVGQDVEVRMVIASNVACRSAPDVSSPNLRRLDAGERIAASEAREVDGETWHLDRSRTREGCWVHAALTAEWSDPEAGLLDAVERILARTDPLTLEEVVAVDNLLLRTPSRSHAPDPVIEHSPLLQFRRIQLLERASRLPEMDPREVRRSPLKAAWVLANRDILHYYEPAGAWLVLADTYWDLYDENRQVEWAEELAWAAARGDVAGDECDGPCILGMLLRTYARYWRAFPGGRWVEEAVERAAARTAAGAEVECAYSTREEALAAAQAVREGLVDVEARGNGRLLERVEAIERSCREG